MPFTINQLPFTLNGKQTIGENMQTENGKWKMGGTK